MAASSQVSRNKRGRDEWNSGLALPDGKSANGVRWVHDSYLMALLDMIDNMDAFNSNPEETHTAIQLQEETVNGVIKSVEDETGLKGLADDVKSVEDETGLKGLADDVESVDVDEKGGSIKQITDWNTEVISASDTGNMHSEENLTYYDDVCAELGFFVDHTAVELGIIMSFFDEDSMANMYSDAVYGYSEAVYGCLWGDDIW